MGKELTPHLTMARLLNCQHLYYQSLIAFSEPHSIDGLAVYTIAHKCRDHPHVQLITISLTMVDIVELDNSGIVRAGTSGLTGARKAVKKPPTSICLSLKLAATI